MSTATWGAISCILQAGLYPSKREKTRRRRSSTENGTHVNALIHTNNDRIVKVEAMRPHALAKKCPFHAGLGKRWIYFRERLDLKRTVQKQVKLQLTYIPGKFLC